MPGLKLIEVILGLVFVYLLLSLLCTAINEYVSGILNKRGRALFKAVDQLIGDPDVQAAFRRHPLISTLCQSKRLPSYIPAQNFALALLGSTDYTETRLGATSSSPPESPPVSTPPKLEQLFDALMQESPAQVSPLVSDPAVASLLGSAAVPESVRTTVTGAVAGVERDVQKLQNAVEVWFNNAMDRVSGTYKRYTQIALLLIGLVVSILLNADTLHIWQTLSTNDQAREALVQRAIAFNAAARDTTPGDTTAAADTTCAAATGEAAARAVAKAAAGQRLTCGEALAVVKISKAQLDSTQLALGWTDAELETIGVATQGADGKLSPVPWPWKWTRAIWPKLLGLLLTAIAISLGAPFWFDMLNKIINIRAAGRAPDERPKNPEARGKRLAEVAPK